MYYDFLHSWVTVASGVPLGKAGEYQARLAQALLGSGAELPYYGSRRALRWGAPLWSYSFDRAGDGSSG